MAEIRGRGLMLGVEFVKDRERLKPFAKEDNFTARVVSAGICEGVFFYPSGVDAVILGPPLVISDEEIKALVNGLEQALDSAMPVHAEPRPATHRRSLGGMQLLHDERVPVERNLVRLGRARSNCQQRGHRKNDCFVNGLP